MIVFSIDIRRLRRLDRGSGIYPSLEELLLSVGHSAFLSRQSQQLPGKYRTSKKIFFMGVQRSQHGTYVYRRCFLWVCPSPGGGGMFLQRSSGKPDTQ